MANAPVYEGLGPGENEKRCYRCKEVKPTSEFNKDAQKKDGLCTYCKQCQAARSDEFKRANPDSVREYHLKRTFGLTLEQWDTMLERQGGRCAICRKKSGKGRFHVDHDHSCCPGTKTCGNCVRGLLCRQCNQILLGFICRESTKGTAHAVEVLERAISYLNGVAPVHGHEVTSDHGE